ncbi:MAG: hypothetical protein JRJ58_03260 [Deltaproteobacteria bacterium]|nr:hypothetical protein [Deltaproteobacteria bacterium]
MAQPIQSIPVDHNPRIQVIDANPKQPALPLTLLELVQAVNEVSDSENEPVATVVYMLRSGRIQLAGSFRDESLDGFYD